MKTNEEIIKAYLVTCSSFSRTLQMIWPARSPGQAKGNACYHAQQAGYEVQFIDFRAQRAPLFDDIAQEAVGKVPWCLGWVEDGESWGCLKGVTDGYGC